jgi:hypothetical protein
MNYSFIDENVSTGTYQYRLKQVDFDGSHTYSDIVEVDVTGPTQFSLEQNYPNPFNPTTKIRYQIPASLNPSQGGTLVQLIVYDVLGNEIATLVNEEKTAGNYELEFDATGLPSGVYFYQLNAGNYIETKKMLLMK